MCRLEIGKIVNTHGLRGEVKVLSWTDSPSDFEYIKHVVAEKKEEINLTISSVRYQKSNLIVKFKEINSIEEAELLKNVVLTTERKELPPLPDGKHYIVDLIGCTVIDKGREIGVIKDVFEAGGGNVYEIDQNGKTVLVPANPTTVISADTDSKIIVMNVPDEWEEG